MIDGNDLWKIFFKQNFYDYKKYVKSHMNR